MDIHCKFFLLGSCRNGSKCTWKHDKPVEEAQRNSLIKSINQKNKVSCKYFRMGECTKGDDCLFLHEAASNEKAKIVCSFWKNSTCLKGIYCPYLHSEPAPEVEEKEEHACSICYTDCIKEKKKFGLLNNCDHIFCLDCIRTWRDSSKSGSTGPVTHTCPVCRVKSYYVIPSTVHAAGDKKKEIEQKYKNTLKGIPCKYFNFGKGCCPFYTNCFYSHLNEDGTPAKNIPLPPKKKRKTVDQVDLLRLYLSLLEAESDSESSEEPLFEVAYVDDDDDDDDDDDEDDDYDDRWRSLIDSWTDV